ncbi:hypothetical protein CRYUN_Cryun01aG0058300 [Craigia yunnanensis]
MDSVSICRGQLAYFRLKELKDVLTQLGISKQGKKQDLMDRILGLISDEEVSRTHGPAKKKVIEKEGVVKLIDDAYRKMRIADAPDLATKKQTSLDIGDVKQRVEAEDFSHSTVKIYCPCGSSLHTDSMIQCSDPGCQVQQHVSCVIIPERPMEGIPSVPPIFHCEMCRINRADPFYVTVAHLISPVKLIAPNIPSDGTNPLLNVEKTFQLTKADNDLLQNTEYDIQAWCVLLNDNVSFRMQWPQYADLHVNGFAVRTINRPGSQLLGANGRDDGALITLYIREGGINTIYLSACDARFFCFGVRIVKRRTIEQVLGLIPKETDGESFEDALAHVCRCIGGGMPTVNEDSDSDLEVIADTIPVNLRCPMSGSRIKVAGRFKPCVHMGCFDLETFVELNQRSRKWQCPICLKNYSLEDIIIDPYFNRITTMMRHCGEDVTDIEVKPDGSWTVKTKGELSDLGKWHFPDGSLYVASNEDIFKPEVLRLINKEEKSGHTNPEIRTKGGMMEARKHQHLPMLNPKEEDLENYSQMVIAMSSSASGSGRDDEDLSINQDYGRYNNISANNDNEINSIRHNFDSILRTENQSYGPMAEPDVITLSDSEEENVNLVSSHTDYKSCLLNDSGALSAPPAIEHSYLENSILDSGITSCLDLLNGSSKDFGMSDWPYSSTQSGSGLKLFGEDSDVSDVLIDLEHSVVKCSAPMNGYTLASKSTMNSSGQVPDSSICNANIDEDDDLVDNPFAFVNEDPSLQNFLPTQPVGTLEESDIGHCLPISNGTHTEDWTSLRLGSNGDSIGSGVVGTVAQSAVSKGLDLINDCRPNEGRKKLNGPFSFPRQPRSVRRRVYTIDSD